MPTPLLTAEGAHPAPASTPVSGSIPHEYALPSQLSEFSVLTLVLKRLDAVLRLTQVQLGDLQSGDYFPQSRACTLLQLLHE